MTAGSDYECTENCPDAVLVLTQPATADFVCTYELSGRTTVYSWYLDGVLLPGYTTPTASVDIPDGDHIVECRASIIVETGCECDATIAFDITVLGTQYELSD